MGTMSPEGVAPRSIVLAVPEDGLFAPIIQSGFAQAGWGAILVHRPDALREVLGDRGAALVVLDMAIPGAQEALHALKLEPATNWVPILAIFPRGNDPRYPAEIRMRADVELLEPVEIHRLIAEAESHAVRSSEPPSTRKIRLVLPSRRPDLERALEIGSAFLRASSLEEAAQAPLLAGVREAIGNAIQHGNRGDPAKRILVEYRQNPAALTLTVRDEGPGFDAPRYLRRALSKGAVEAARDRHRAGGQGGLGMLMLLRCADAVRYNKTGNLCTLTKFLRKRPAPPPEPEPEPGFATITPAYPMPALPRRPEEEKGRPKEGTEDR